VPQRFWSTLAAVVKGVATSPFRTNAPQVELKAGDMAPPFDLRGSDGRDYRLSDFRGRSAVVLAWFPKAFTAG
jgi:peroxiredoxin Q/BCP